MRFQGQLADTCPAGHNTLVTLNLLGEHAEALETLTGLLDVEVKPHRQRRSLNANALCWELCSQIGRALTPPMAKEDVYRRAIRAVGEYVYMRVKVLDWEKFKHAWESNGVGWFAEQVQGNDVMAYYGSSIYDTKAMSTLIDYLIDEARQMELPVVWDDGEIDRIKAEWEERA